MAPPASFAMLQPCPYSTDAKTFRWTQFGRRMMTCRRDGETEWAPLPPTPPQESSVSETVRAGVTQSNITACSLNDL